jgi:hypothetical protein
MPMLFMTLVAALLTAGSAFAAQVKPAKDTVVSQFAL